MTSLTELDVKRQLRRLAAVHRPPDDFDGAVRIWQDVLEGVTKTELMSAVGEYLKADHRYFPKPGQIRQDVLRNRVGQAPQAVRSHGPDPALECPACGAKLRELAPAEQVLWLWDEDEGRRTQRLPESQAKRLGILHDLSVSHTGLAVSYGRYGA